MQNLIDKILATRRDRASARVWSDYAISNYGLGSLAALQAGFDEPMHPRVRRTLRLAIRMVEDRLHQRIWVTTMPNVAPAGIVDAR